MRVAFDSRPSADRHGGGQYAQCLLQALRETAGEQEEIRESRRPRGADVFHAPWMEAAMLHSPCPMVVTLHDLTDLQRPSERLRCGGMHLRLRHLALARATRVIVPSAPVAAEAAVELGIELERIVVIPHPSDLTPPTAGRPKRVPSAGWPDGALADRGPADGALDDRIMPAWTWRDVARETWAVYRLAFAQPHRSYVVRRSEQSVRRSEQADRRPERVVRQ